MRVDGITQNPWIGPLSKPHKPFFGPLVTISDFEGGAAFLAVCECPWCRLAGIFDIFVLKASLTQFEGVQNIKKSYTPYLEYTIR